MFILRSIILYAVALQVVHALPLMQRIVIAPQITRPNADTIWTPGNNELVTWDTSIVPPTGDFKGRLILGYQTVDSENLDLQHPLADGFSLRDGSVLVACPTVPPGNKYIVVLFGDSGNASPQFTISSATNNSSGTPASSSGQPPSPATSTTSVPLSPMALASTSSSSTPTSTPRPGTLSPSQEFDISTALATSISPTAGSSRNGAVPRTRNVGAMTVCTVIAVFAVFFF